MRVSPVVSNSSPLIALDHMVGSTFYANCLATF